jgi:hypothetical protein
LDFPPNSEISSGGFNFSAAIRFSAGTSGVPPTIWIFRLKIPIFGGTFETPAELLIFRGLRFFAGCGKRIQPDLFAAIQQQLGLRFESSRARIDTIVIDSVQRLSEN